MAQREHGGDFSVDVSVPIAAADRAGRERLLRYCARPPFTPDRLHELDPEHLPCGSAKPLPGGTGPLRLRALQLDRLATLVAPPRFYRHHCFGAPVRTTAYGKFLRRARPSARRRKHAVAS